MVQSLEEIADTLRKAVDRRRFNKILFFSPYDKQRSFFDLGRTKRERLFMAGNQLGKTEGGAVESTLHLTGEYPDSWNGKRFQKPTIGWIAGITSKDSRDIQQAKLCGPPGMEEAFGSGYIPRHLFADKPSMARGITDAYDTIQVTHKTDGVVDGVSIGIFKSYEQGRKKFQGGTVDWLWLDEEPPIDIYSEALTRTTATKGIVYITFTPLLGMSQVVQRFTQEASPDRAVVQMEISEALHIPPEEREKIIAGYLPHEREARAKGVPMLGSGRILTELEANVLEPYITTLPLHWAKLWGIDFGIGHPFAAVLIAWDKDADIIHVLHTYRQADALPLQHVAAMKPIAHSTPVAWPKDGDQREKATGIPLQKHYKELSLEMLPKHATWPEGGDSTEAGILELQQREATGRIKYASHLTELLEERRMYHRRDGEVVKLQDDILSALRIAVMMKRYARPGPLGSEKRRRSQSVATDVDFPLW